MGCTMPNAASLRPWVDAAILAELDPCLGECIPAQALSQTYEVVSQLRGNCGPRQVKNAKVGFSVNSGKLGNSSAVVYKR